MKIKYGLLILWLWPVVSMAQVFTPVWESPYNPMTFYVMTAAVNDEDLQAGDEIGIYDIDPVTGSEICVGAGVLTEVLGAGVYLEMIASMDDGSNPDQANGFTPGNDFVFRLYSQIWGMIGEVEFTFPYPGYDEVFTAQGNTIVNLQGTPEPLEPFQPVWESPYNPMTFYITGAQIDGVDLAAGDQIGIFDIDTNSGEEICVGAATLSAPVSPEDYLEMIASMDDGSLPGQATGFTPGNNFIFKFISQDMLLVEQVFYEFPYPGYDEVFTAQGNTIVSLSGTNQPLIQHSIQLQTGWNGMSSFLIPENTNISIMLSNIAGEFQIIKNQDLFYMPDNPQSTLLNWDYGSGYFIKMNNEQQFTINGFSPENKNIMLTEGWNLIPVLSENELSVYSLFSENMDKIIIIKEASGLKVFWPEHSITTLQLIAPGKAYLIKTNQTFSINYESF